MINRLRLPRSAGLPPAFVMCLAMRPAVADDDGPRPADLAAALAAEDRASLVADVERLGDASRGSTLFHTRRFSCVQCHAVGEGPASLGPNLAGRPAGVPPGRAPLVEHLVESIPAPSAVIRPEYRGVTVLTDDGRSLTGIVARESDDELVLRDTASGEITLRTSSIDDRVPAAASLMPQGLANLLTDRGQFLDLVRYLAEVAEGGQARARALPPDPAVLVAPSVAAYEATIDHAGLIADWVDAEKSKSALERGSAIYGRVCANCHGTLDEPGSLPTAPRFGSGGFKHGSDPSSMYRTLTHGAGQMVAQTWMVPQQKYDVIHFIRETFLRDHNPQWYTAFTPDYLAGLPAGDDAGAFAVDMLSPTDANPWNARMRLSGIDFTGPDEAVLCTWDGDVWTVRGIGAAAGTLAWRRIATGLYQPLGITVIAGTIHVGCRDRIVKLVDIDGDGLTDRYDTFNDDHEVTEYFHEFAMGLETDAAGNLCYAKSGRHGLPAVVPHHGTLLKVARDGSSTGIVATGFRAANGVCVESDGRVVRLPAPDFKPAWCHAVEWNVTGADGDAVRGVLHGTMH